MISVSVITVSYNAIAEIEKTIISVLSQKECSVQYIIIDGNSHDGTQEVIRKYRKQIDVFISEPDAGIYDAMNKGLKYIRGDYVIFMNAGDTFYDDMVVYNCLSGNLRDGVIYGKAKWVYNNPYKEVTYAFKANRFNLTRKNICHQTIFYPRSCFNKGNNYNTKYKILADWEFNIRIYKKLPFYFINRFVCNYPCDGISSSNAIDSEFMLNLPVIIKQDLGALPYVFFLIRQGVRRGLRLIIGK